MSISPAWLKEHDKKIREDVMDEFGILHGEDAKRFERYINGDDETPCTPEGIALIKRANELAKTFCFDPKKRAVHDATIRKDEREKILKEILIVVDDCVRLNDYASYIVLVETIKKTNNGDLESLRQQEQKK